MIQTHSDLQRCSWFNPTKRVQMGKCPFFPRLPGRERRKNYLSSRRQTIRSIDHMFHRELEFTAVRRRRRRMFMVSERVGRISKIGETARVLQAVTRREDWVHTNLGDRRRKRVVKMGAFRRTWLIAFLFIRLSTELVPVVSAHTRKLDNSSSLFSVYPTPCFPGTFIFGDSLVDNGNAMAVYPDRFARLEQDPFGVSWPGHGADRFCDGKLIGDYLCNCFQASLPAHLTFDLELSSLPIIWPYMLAELFPHDLASKFLKFLLELLHMLAAWGTGGFPMSAYLRSVQTLLFLGVNLAASGSTVLPGLTLNPIFQDDEVFPHTPFTLDQQLQWYKHFMFRDSELSKG